MVLGQLDQHIRINNLLPNYQSSYKKNYSTETVLIKLQDQILYNMEDQKVSAMVAIDLSAVFDTADNGIMCDVLERCFGIEKPILNWFRTYLQNRKFEVQVGNVTSELKTINYSVPQGSCAGPVLFMCYTSTLDTTTSHRSADLLGYADDHALTDSFHANDRD